MAFTSLLLLLLQFPPAGSWPERLDPAYDAVAAFAIANEAATDRNLEIAHYQSFGREPFGDGIGPFKERGPATGLIIRNGVIVAKWGEPERVDMTFSVTKSFLSATVGLAFDRGLIPDIHQPAHLLMAPIHLYDPFPRSRAERVGEPMLLELFGTPHNRSITWDHLLRQTSDWEGSLWGKPDWADRPERDIRTDLARERHAAGTVYEYNDVRVNVLALAALNVWRRPLPEVLKAHLMDPIGASGTWRWMGYDQSWVVIDGSLMQAVGGGGHWGGGMFINAYDMARFGWLLANDGVWNGRRVLSSQWLSWAATPGVVNADYGFMNGFIRADGGIAHLGNGTNVVFVHPERKIVAVARWIRNDQLDTFLKMVLEVR
jgi:CubicO group peptidase (beta-lactamase class C family)